jgi:hypothetical protein
MQPKTQTCATCRFFCQDDEAKKTMYFDPQTGECRFGPPSDNYTWKRTRPEHWCGQWKAHAGKQLIWRKITSHEKDATPVLLFQQSKFCRKSGMIIGYWNDQFNKFHDDGDRLIGRDEVTDWMPLPDPPTG